MKHTFSALLALLLAAVLLVSCGPQKDSADTKTETVSAPEDRPSSSGSDNENGTQAPEVSSDLDTESDTENDTSVASQNAFRVSGSFCSDTGTYMDLTVNWTAESEDGVHVTLTLTAVLNCYSIEVGARPGMGKLTVGNAEYAFSTPALRQEENVKTSFEFFTRTLTLSADDELTVLPDGSFSLPVRVVWPFNGVYGKKQISDVTAAAVLTFGGD